MAEFYRTAGTAGQSLGLGLMQTSHLLPEILLRRHDNDSAGDKARYKPTEQEYLATPESGLRLRIKAV
ncbi:uncharacterized protein MYCFIDRAFT_209589 [Pseudocercospora fijiensis CIRAD86]|uniref:Uncharacterized protein n=1 Tax=Pseudocercospora fijiensis (strain CIRAD86) TaxID=383855 RepID=N1Q9X2_PSEFD|nr:uncharacterized protein MYCFIDRAFT_209589 [Pseudocercospora fijiensis CIRAD86]EME87697.1 hypothetical protein MYCFIDRAFT_209589 [Pseudocercospora fijiensis CIRAD86]